MPTEPFDAAHAEYLRSQRRGLLATVAPNGAPQNKPVGFRYRAELGTIDVTGFDMERSAKFRNVALRPQVAFTVDDAPDPAAGSGGVRFMEIRGTAEQVELEAPPFDGASRWIIRIHPRRFLSWNVGAPGMHSGDVAGAGSAAGDLRPAVALSGPPGDRGLRAIERQVAELQAGLHDEDAEIYNRHFSADIMWGSPYGARVRRPRRLPLRDRPGVDACARRRARPGPPHRAR
jgi:pyridoxamine 5'-phosphate oxidase family protein